jgi:hypothetical protein
MKGLIIRLPLAVAVVLGTLLLSLPTVAIASPQDKKVFGEVRSDAALVYIYWAWSGKFHIFCDDQLVGVLRGYDYTFAYIAPGTHFFWGDLGGFGLSDFAAGQTYYLSFKYRLSVLSEADGQATIKRAKGYRQLTEEQCTKAAGRIAKTWPKYKGKLGSKLMPAGGEIAYTSPASTENMVKIPASTAVMAELMENLASGINKAGDTVWLCIVEDIRIDGNLFVQAGAPVKALLRGVNKRGHFGAGGYLDLTMVSLVAADGTICPLFGQVATAGTNKSTTLAAVVGGFPAAALVRGTESFHPAGEVVKVFTRQDIWIKPLPATSEKSSVAQNPEHFVKAYAPDKVVCDFRKSKIPQVVQIIFEGSGDIASAELFEVAGRQIPTPIRASNLSRVKEGWIAQFGGWDLCRFLRPGDAGTPLAFRLTATDGTVVIAQGVVPMTLQ